MLYKFAFLVFCVVNIDGVKKENACSKDGVPGICTELKKCLTAIQDIKNKKNPQICEFRGLEPVVCCSNSDLTKPGYVSTTTKRSPLTTDFVVTDVDKYSSNGHKECDCDPIAPAFTAATTGRIAWDKCIEYQQLVYPCQKNPLSPNMMVRGNKCHHSAHELIITNQAGRLEFPHAVLLGYGNDLSQLDWLCGGALISDRFILTAAHCTVSRENGLVTYAAIHPADRTRVDPESVYKIKEIINHPEFKPPRTYHDISLLDLVAPVPLDSFTVPACLQTTESETDSRQVIATTWNTNNILKSNVTQLQKVYLTKFSSSECSKIYPNSGRRAGFNDTTQVCYGHKTASKDICQDDGGNPVLVENKKISCMYTIIGITSYGKGCLNHSPGVYTRVERYVDWIESVVWP